MTHYPDQGRPVPPEVGRFRKKTTATARKQLGAGDQDAEARRAEGGEEAAGQYATVTLGIQRTEKDSRYFKRLVALEECSVQGAAGAEAEDVRICESAVFHGAFHALRQVGDYYGFVILGMEGRIDECGAEGFAVAAMHAVWQAIGYEPGEEERTEINGWTWRGEGEVIEAPAAMPADPNACGSESENPEET